MTRVGIIGYGEAGCAIAAGLAKAGTPVTVFDARFDDEAGDELRSRAVSAGAEVVADAAAVAAAADVVLSVVSSSAALPVARALAPHLTERHLVADLNTTSPSLAREVAEIVEETGATFADVAMMAAVPAHQHRVRMLASGGGAQRLADLDVGFRIEVLADRAGAASAIKMLRSLLVKGLESLLLEFAVAARRMGATEEVLRGLNGTLPLDDWTELTSYLLARTAQHGERRGQELREVAAMLHELGIEPLMAMAGAERLLWAAEHGLADHFRGAPPKHYDDVLDVLEGKR